MTALYHAYTQTVADGTATSVVRPSDWNSAHVQGQTLSGNTSGFSTVSGTNIVLQGGNNVTLSAVTAASAATIVISGANTVAQSVQTQASGAIAGTGFTSTTTAGTAVVATQGTNGLSMAVPAYITTYVNDLTSGRAGTGFTSTTTAGTAITAALGTNGLSMAVPAYITTYVNDLTSGRAGTGTTLALTNLSGTLSVNTNGVALSLNNADANFMAWELEGVNTAGTTATTLTTTSPLYLSGGNNITLSGNSNTIVISAGAGGGTTNQTGPNIGVSNLGATAGSTGTVSTGNVVLVGTNGILLSQSTGAVGSNATISIQPQLLYAWANNLYQVNSQTIQPRQSTSVVFPVMINNAVSFDHIRFPLTVSMNSTTVGTTASTTFSLGVFYTFNVGFYSTDISNATSMGSVLTTSAGMTHQISVGAITGSRYTITNFFTYPANTAGGTATFSTSFAASVTNIAFSTTHLTQFTGMKHLQIAMASSLSQDMYWVVYGVSSTTSTQGNAGISTNFLIHSNWGMSQPNNTWGMFGQANDASIQAISGVGSFTTAGGGTTGGLGFSNVSSSASHVVPYIYMEYDG